MKYGEVITVIVPSASAYGTNGFYGKSIPDKKRFVISPNTTLVYEIEVWEMKYFLIKLSLANSIFKIKRSDGVHFRN
jgi:hypothetical protein